ncbi:MAG: hypothetical protein PSV16_12730 [Flavobacterium sp.]|nr:hypothetical protein [Flavobacterium sp.]
MKNKFIYISIFFLISIKCLSQGVPADDLFRAYVQDTANNCASIALIKANLNAFGLKSIYSVKALDADTNIYTLKNKDEVSITKVELDLAAKQFRVNTTNATTPYLKSIVDTSVVCYAIMAKRLHIILPQLSKGNYKDDLAYISDVSFTVYDGVDLLGTGDYVVNLGRHWRKITGKKGVVVWSPHHTVFASERKCDMPGEAAEFHKWTKSYIRFYGRMYIDTEEVTPPVYNKK